MQRIVISDYFKKELNLRHNIQKLKEIQKLSRESYSIKLETQPNGKEAMALYCDGDKGLIAFLEDYLEMYDPNKASAQDTVIILDGKIREIINEGGEMMEAQESREVKKTRTPKKLQGEEKYSIDEIRVMFAEFVKLDEQFAPRIADIEKWVKLKEVFKR